MVIYPFNDRLTKERINRRGMYCVWRRRPREIFCIVWQPTRETLPQRNTLGSRSPFKDAFVRYLPQLSQLVDVGILRTQSFLLYHLQPKIIIKIEVLYFCTLVRFCISVPCYKVLYLCSLLWGSVSLYLGKVLYISLYLSKVMCLCTLVRFCISVPW